MNCPEASDPLRSKLFRYSWATPPDLPLKGDNLIPLQEIRRHAGVPRHIIPDGQTLGLNRVQTPHLLGAGFADSVH